MLYEFYEITKTATKEIAKNKVVATIATTNSSEFKGISTALINTFMPYVIDVGRVIVTLKEVSVIFKALNSATLDWKSIVKPIALLGVLKSMTAIEDVTEKLTDNIAHGIKNNIN